MANDTSNSSYEKMMDGLPSSDCISWLVIAITECLVIVVFNIITIIVFVKQRQLQRHSTYLIIHLAIVDLLVGAVTAPLIIHELLGIHCDLWEYDFKIYYLFVNLFPTTSVVNLAVISLERLHATFFPFKHRVLKKWIYVLIIAVVWLITTSREFVKVMLYVKGGMDSTRSVNSSVMLFFRPLASLFIICVSYISIFIKIRCCPQPQHHGAANRERQLTSTLVLVTLLSVLSWLPHTIFTSMNFFHGQTMSNLSRRSYFHTKMALLALIGANSLANPIVYAVRMPEFRAGITKIFRRVPNHISPAGLPLENLLR